MKCSNDDLNSFSDGSALVLWWGGGGQAGERQGTPLWLLLAAQSCYPTAGDVGKGVRPRVTLSGLKLWLHSLLSFGVIGIIELKLQWKWERCEWTLVFEAFQGNIRVLSSWWSFCCSVTEVSYLSTNRWECKFLIMMPWNVIPVGRERLSCLQGQRWTTNHLLWSVHYNFTFCFQVFVLAWLTLRRRQSNFSQLLTMN